ncbi:MAG: serine/threonine-protein kinase, partial [Deltaproteobacteria bacterium]
MGPKSSMNPEWIDAPTLADSRPDSGAGDPVADLGPEIPLAVAPITERYDAQGMLGIGGMGEVRLVHDRRIGRDVALKVLRDSAARDPNAVARFLREARIQGQLEHPTVVPVHDMALDAGGMSYFTMKRVRGLTLTNVLARLTSGDPGTAARFSRHRLLTAFCSVCMAVDFAHQRGVVHRDLKPENIMLGDHGEVHLLDWGVARLISEQRENVAPDADVHATPQGTAFGSVVGTPGYMAPEQAAGDVMRVGPASDVYALGAILFEILTLQPLHAGDTVVALLSATLQGADARAALRAPDAGVPPELDAICQEATRLEPADRLASARVLCERIERY